MLGLIALVGLLLLIATLLVGAAAVYGAARLCGAAPGRAAGVALAVVVMCYVGFNAPELYETHLYNNLCRNTAGRHIRAVVTGVEGVRIVGDGDDDLEDIQSVEPWSVFHGYGYIEWTSGPLKWRSNGRSADICRPASACNVESFSARYELHVRNATVFRNVTTRQKTIVDTATGQVLAEEKTVYLEQPSLDLSMRNLLLVFWRLPRELIQPDETCLRVDEESFVSRVLVPKAGPEAASSRVR